MQEIAKLLPQKSTTLPSITNKDGVYYIVWPNTPIPRKIYDQIISRLSRKLNFGFYHCDTFECGQVASINSSLIKQFSISHPWMIDSKINKLAELYNSGTPFSEICDQFNFAPLQMITKIFKKNNIEPHITTRIVKSWKRGMTYETHPFAYEFIKKCDYDSLVFALEHDQNNPEHTTESSIYANLMEAIFVSFFICAGIKLKTEDDLRKEKSQLTPDILFVSDVYINDKRVHWIDFKSYAGTDVPLFYKSNSAQVQKYNMMYGPGAVCYKYSFVENLIIDSLLLDGSSMSYDDLYCKKK